MDSKKELAVKCDEVIRTSSEALSRSSLRIGWYGFILRKNNLFGELGFSSEEQYYRDREIGRSTWYRAVAIAERLEHLGKDRVLAMNVENARILAKVPEDRADFEYLAVTASKTPTKEFARIAQISGVSTGAINVRHLEIVIPVSAAEKKTILSALTKWQHEHDLPSLSAALLHFVNFIESRDEDAA